MPVRTAYAGAAVAGEVLTAANVNKLPGGWIGYAEVTANQGGITTEIDLTSLSVAVTVGTSRRIRISYIGSVATSVSGDTAVAYIKEGAAYLQQSALTMPSGANEVVNSSVVLTPTAGAHTYKITMARLAGTGTLQHTVSATSPGYILVEDLGPAI